MLVRMHPDDRDELHGVTKRASRKVGGYEITVPLGRGGFGEVYEGYRADIGKRAAVKILKREHSQDPKFAQRFLHEARSVNIINHPGLVEIFELGQEADGTLFIIMELLNGETLDKRIQRSGGRLGLASLLLIRQAASALHAAHLQGIVHRDLKPSNLMVVADPEVPGGERIKVLDFGLAKLPPEHQEPGKPTLSTTTGYFMGSFPYAAPEQMTRGAKDVDGLADVYSLGVILYEIFAGRRPFEGGWTELMVAHLKETPPQPLRQFAPAIPETLEALVGKMLAKTPDKRPGMNEVEEELVRLASTATRRSGRSALPLENDAELPLSDSRRGLALLSLIPLDSNPAIRLLTRPYNVNGASRHSGTVNGGLVEIDESTNSFVVSIPENQGNQISLPLDAVISVWKSKPLNTWQISLKGKLGLSNTDWHYELTALDYG